MNLQSYLFLPLLLSVLGGNALQQQASKAAHKAFHKNTSLSASRDTIIDNFTLKGTVMTRTNQPLAGVQISLYVDTILKQKALTDEQGRFSFVYDTSVTIYRLKAEKLTTEDKFKGITTFDIARIRKHIVGIEPFTSPFEYLAADVDNSREVDGADGVLINNFILRKQPLLPSGVWRFMDNAYQFKNLANPLVENISNEIILKKGNMQVSANFLALKMGDVNGTYGP